MDIDWIRKGLMKPGKSQRGLALALGVDASAVNRLLKGTRQLKAAEIEKAQIYLDAPIGLKVLTPESLMSPKNNDDKIRVLGMAECGPDGWSLWNGEIVDYVSRPANLSGAANAYAVFAVGNSMDPRYHAGELVYIHPGKPVTPGCYVLVQMQPKEDGAAPRAILKRLARRSGTKIILEQFNPAKTFDLKTSEIVSMHRIVGSGES